MKSLAEIKKTISKLKIVDLNRSDASYSIEKILYNFDLMLIL